MRDVVEGIILLLFSLVAIWGAWLVPAAGPSDTWAGIVPFSASVVLLGLSCIIVLNGLRTTSDNGEADADTGKGTLDIIGLFIIALIYQQSFRWFGYVLPTAIVAPVVLYIFGVRSKVGLVLSVIICPFVFHIIFFELLGVFPPFGEIFDLLDWFRG